MTWKTKENAKNYKSRRCKDFVSFLPESWHFMPASHNSSLSFVCSLYFHFAFHYFVFSYIFSYIFYFIIFFICFVFSFFFCIHILLEYQLVAVHSVTLTLHRARHCWRHIVTYAWMVNQAFMPKMCTVQVAFALHSNFHKYFDCHNGASDSFNWMDQSDIHVHMYLCIHTRAVQ